jgi:hypothetical protein
MTAQTARMLTDSVGNLIDQSYDSSTDTFVADKSTGGAKHVDVKAIVLLSGERVNADVLAVESQNESISVARTTADASVGTGAAGDYLERVVLTVAVTTAALEVKDKSGTVLAVFLTTDAVGTVREVKAIATGAGFAVTLHASGAGTVTCIGRFS